MASGMDKGLMALMGLEDDTPVDDGIAAQPLERSESQEGSDFFDPLSDSDNDISISSTHKPSPVQPKTTYLQNRQPLSDSNKRSSPSMSPPPAPRASTSSLFSSSLFPRSPSPPTSKAATSLFSPGFGPSKTRTTKSPKKNRGSAGDFSMFSPTLSPRKPKRASSSTPSSTLLPKATIAPTPISTAKSTLFSGTSLFPQKNDVRTTSLSPDLTPTSVSRRGPASPLSSFDLKKQSLGFSDSDSDISPWEEGGKSFNSLPESQKVSLKASYTLDAALGMDLDDSSDDELPTIESATKVIPMARDIVSQNLDRNKGDDHNVSIDRDMDEIMASNSEANKIMKKSKAAIQMEQKQLQVEKERLLRSSTYKVDQRFKKQTLTSLLESAQSRLKAQPATSQAISPIQNAPAAVAKKKISRTIALDDSSEDETEQDAERREEEAQWKRSATKALLLSSVSKKERNEISQELKAATGSVSMDRRLELERTLQMSPLSNKIQKMTLEKPSESPSNSASSTSTIMSPPPKPIFSQASSLGLTSPQKNQKFSTVTNIRDFNLQMERQLAKTHLMRRKKLEEEAKKSGIWKSPEDHAAEQLRIEEKRSQGLDPDEEADDDEDGDYNPQNQTADGNESEEERGSADELGSEDSENDDHGDDDSKQLDVPEQNSDDDVAPGEDKAHNSEIGDDDDASDDADEDAEDSDTDDDEENVAPKRRINRKGVIGDDDDIKVVIVDRSQAIAASESEEDEAGSDSSISGDDDEDGSDEDDNEDVDDIEQDMEGIDDTQGFGAFFESSYDPAKDKKAGERPSFGRAPISLPESTISPILGSDPSQLQASYDNTQGSMDGALDYLSGKFPTQTQQTRNSSAIQESQQSSVFSSQMHSSIESHSHNKNTMQFEDSNVDSPKVRNAFEIMQSSGLRRLHKREAKPRRGPISKGDKSAFIEYEAEEEEDEHMGMGGIDYESDPDKDDYDLADGMVDTNIVLDSQDVENVKQLHMKHEQDRHDKEISDLVHGIAAGNLWKRRNGQNDDLDLFDEEDMDGRFRRKKKLKVSEKFEKLADNPNTAAFARAFEKNMDDDQLVFLSDADESADENRAEKDNEDSDNETTKIQSRQKFMSDESGSEDDEESLNTDKRRERLNKARLARIESNQSFSGSMDPDAIAAMTNGQVLPFDIAPDEDWLSEGSENVSALSPMRSKAKSTESSSKTSASQADTIDEYKDVLRRTKVIRDILDGVDEVIEDETMASPSRPRPSLIGLMDRIIDRTSSTNSGLESGSSHNDVDVTAIVRPRMLARQNSSFLSEDRRSHFLSTVGEDNRGGSGSSRVVKEVNRRKMVFTTAKKSVSSTSSTSTTLSAAAVTVTSSSTATTSSKSNINMTSIRKSTKAVPGVQNGSSNSSSGRLLQILSLEDEE
ncbi:hypothetical protein FBU30_006919 [Linnemannia zychae]|nr:hypothetical protein FBU30_006919 [Linnemannia zychae]